MIPKQLTPEIGRLLLGQLETPKRESQLELEGYKSWDPWDHQNLTGFLQELARRADS